jgi:hypothetical protein
MTVSRCLALDYASNFLFQALGVGAVCGIVLGLGFLSCAVLLSIDGPALAEFWWCSTLFLLVAGGGVLQCLVALRCCCVPLGRCCFGGAVVAV